MKFETRYTADVSDRTPGVSCDPMKGLTKQSFEAECDINTIMKRYMQTGVAPGSNGMARYGDYSEVGDYLEAQDVVQIAQQQFKTLPARVRERFKHDPAELLDFVANPANKAEAQMLGLLKEEVAEVAKPLDEVKKA